MDMARGKFKFRQCENKKVEVHHILIKCNKKHEWVGNYINWELFKEL